MAKNILHTELVTSTNADTFNNKISELATKGFQPHESGLKVNNIPNNREGSKYGHPDEMLYSLLMVQYQD